MSIGRHRQLKILLKHNCLLHRRNICLTLLDILSPIIIFFVLTLIFSEYLKSKVVFYDKARHFTRRSEKDLVIAAGKEYVPAYCPKTKFTEELMTLTGKYLNVPVEGFQDETALNKHLRQVLYKFDHTFAVKFIGVTDEKPTKLKYVLQPYSSTFSRWRTKSLYEKRRKANGTSGSYGYFKHHAIVWKIAIDRSFGEMLRRSGRPVRRTYYFQATPEPIQVVKEFDGEIDEYVTHMIYFSYFISFVIKIHRDLREKEHGITMLMTIIKTKRCVYWFALLIEVTLISMVHTLFYVMFLKYHTKIFQYAHFPTMYILVFLYIPAIYSLAFAVGCIFTRTIIGDLMSLVILFLIQVFTWNGYRFYELEYTHKMIFLLLPSANSFFGFDTIASFEYDRQRVKWPDLFSSYYEETTLGLIYVMLIVDIILYISIAICIENLRPKVSVFDRTVFCPLQWVIDCILLPILSRQRTDLHKEEELPGQEVAIEVKNITKRLAFTIILNNISFNMYKREVTVLLATQRGAGKSTLISIMTGLARPSYGKVRVVGKRRQLQEFGFCPEEDSLYTELTCRENIAFFGKLKGIDDSTIRNYSELLAEKFMFTDKLDTIVAKQFRATRRQVSFTIATIGSPEYMILDEPTSGLDADSRRLMWEVIYSLRDQHVIMISTTNADEAEIFADRIAILHRGLLIAHGTDEYIQQEFGVGYKLEINYGKEWYGMPTISRTLEFPSRNADVVSIIKRINPHVSYTGDEDSITFYLPSFSKPTFPKMFRTIDNIADRYNIDEYDFECISFKEIIRSMDDFILKEATTYSELEMIEEDIAEEEELEAQEEMEDDEDGEGGYESRPEEIPLPRKIKCCTDVGTMLGKHCTVQRRRCCLLLLELILVALVTYLTLELSNCIYDRHPPVRYRRSLELHSQLYGRLKIYHCSDDMALENFYEDLREFAFKEGQLVHPVGDVPKEVLKYFSGTDLHYYYRDMMFAIGCYADNNSYHVLTLHSAGACHGAAIAFHHLSNSAIYIFERTTYTTLEPIQPCPGSVKTMSEQIILRYWVFIFASGLLIYCSQFLLLPLEEFRSGFRQMETMGGIRPSVYWIVFLTWDFFIYLIGLAVIIMVVMFHGDSSGNVFYDSDHMLPLICILLVYGFSSIIFIYNCASYRLLNTTALTFVLNMLWVSYFLVIIVYLISFHGEVYKIVGYAFDVFPQFGLLHCIYHFTTQTIRNYKVEEVLKIDPLFCNKTNNPCCTDPDMCKSYFYGDNNIGPHLFIMIVSALIFLFSLIFFEKLIKDTYNLIIHVFFLTQTRPVKEEADSDTTVEQVSRAEDLFEYERNHTSDILKEYEEDNDVLPDTFLASRIHKRYRGKTLIDSLSFGVKPTERFGIVGKNNAGKTTIVRLISGDLSLSGGDARIYHNNRFYYRSRQFRQYQQLIGYCPQTNAMIGILTAKEMLSMIASIRGVKKSKRNVKHWLRLLHMANLANKRCGTFSQGHKRRLGFGIALLGTPSVVLLDDLTAGIDRDSRKILWHLVKYLQVDNDHLCFIVCSQPQGDSGIVCNKICVLHDGAVQLIDNSTVLKRKNLGFIVVLKLKPDVLPGQFETGRKTEDTSAQESENPERAKLKKDFESYFRGKCELVDERSGLLRYRITDYLIAWEYMFKSTNSLANKHSIIRDFEICRTYLNDVFSIITEDY